MDLWKFLNSDFTILITGFILTTIVGTFLATLFQQRAWKRQIKVELYRKRYDEGVVFLDNLSELIGRRNFLLQKFLWAIEAGNNENMEKASKDYFETVTYWNTCYFKNRNKIRLLVSDSMANYFLDYGDDQKLDKPKSLHYKFVATHQKVLEAKKDKAKLQEASVAVTQLNWKCSAFLEHLTTDFSQRAQKLQLLDESTLIASKQERIQ
jgi:hypothetical protein